MSTKRRGRPSLQVSAPAATALAKELRGGGLPLLSIGKQLAAAGHLNRNGRAYSASSVSSMVR